MIVGFNSLVLNIDDMAYGIYSSQNHVCDETDFVAAINMVDNVMKNWTRDSKILSNTLKLADVILKQMPYGTKLIDENQQKNLVKVLNTEWEKLEPGKFL